MMKMISAVLVVFAVACVTQQESSSSSLEVYPDVGECTTDGDYIWRGISYRTLEEVPGHWERLVVGEACVTIGSYVMDVRDHR